MNNEGTSRPGRRPRRRWVSALCWAGATCAAAASPAWLLSSYAWTIDLVANLNAQWLTLALGWVVVCAGLGRWKAAGLTLGACAMLATPLCLDRAAWMPRDAPMPREAVRGGESVRVLHYNARSEGTIQEHLDLMNRSDADVVSLLAPDVREQFSVIYGNGLEDKYAGKLTRRWKASADGKSTYITAAYVVSRWAITPVAMDDLGEMSEHMMVGRVERPGGAFGVVAVHPRSPRTKQRWTEGNLTVSATVRAVRKLREMGLAVIVIADLNSTPSGLRCRNLCFEGGLWRAKPVLEASGTYPETWPLGLDIRRAPTIEAYWPTTLAIDDVWVESGMQVTGWSCLPPMRSEHRPILVDLEIPPGSGAGEVRR